jgi:hypothetical protein
MWRSGAWWVDEIGSNPMKRKLKDEKERRLNWTGQYETKTKLTHVGETTMAKTVEI